MNPFRKNKATVWLLIAALLLGSGITAPDKAQAAKKSKASKEKLSSKKLTLKKGQTKTLKVKNAQKKIKWSIASGKKYIKLKSKKKASVKVVGKKAGKAKVQAKGKKKLICKVTVQGAGKSTGGSKTTVSKTAQTDKTPTTQTPTTQTPTTPSSGDIDISKAEWVTNDEDLLISEVIFEDSSLVYQLSWNNILLELGNKKTVKEAVPDVSKCKITALLFGEKVSKVAIKDIHWSDEPYSSSSVDSGYYSFTLYAQKGDKVYKTSVNILERYYEAGSKLTVTGVEQNGVLLETETVDDVFNLFSLKEGKGQSIKDVIPDLTKTKIHFSCRGKNYEASPAAGLVEWGEVYWNYECYTFDIKIMSGSQLICAHIYLTSPDDSLDKNRKNESDVAALQKLIAEQKARGANVSEDLDSEEYTWSRKGDLTGINWGIYGYEEGIDGDYPLGAQLLGEISFAELKNLETIDVASSKLTSVDVSSNLALKELDCFDNQLSSLDVSRNPALMNLNCGKNELSSLDVSENPALEDLSCLGNKLSSLDVSSNSALRSLYCGENQLSSLDISKNPELRRLECESNQLSSLDISSNYKLTDLQCWYNQLRSLDVSENPALEWLSCGCNELSSLNISKNPALDNLNCPHNQLSSLDVSKNPALYFLDCSANELSSLDVSSNSLLEALDCSANELSSLDVSSNSLLEDLECSANELSSLDVSSNPLLKNLLCDNNKLSSLDVSSNPALEWLVCSGNQLSNLDVSKNPALTYLSCDEGITVTGCSEDIIVRW